MALALEASGKIYVADMGNQTIRQVTAIGGDYIATVLVVGFSVCPRQHCVTGRRAGL